MYSLIGTVLLCLCLVRADIDSDELEEDSIESEYDDSRFMSRCDKLRNENNATNLPKKEQLEFYLSCGQYAHKKPVKDDHGKLKVQIHFTPKDLEILEPKEILRVTGTLHLTWMHEYHRWDPKDFGSITEFHVDLSSTFWLPRLTHDYKLTNHYFTNFTIRSDGMASVFYYSQLRGDCKSFIRSWPFNKWECPVNLVQFAEYDGLQLSVGPQPFDPIKDVNMSALQVSNQWKIVSNPPFSLAPSSDPSVVIQLSISLQKDPSHYKHIFVVPGIVSFLLSMMSFWLVDHIHCRLMINRFTILVQLVLLLCVYGVVTNSEKKGMGISLQSRKIIDRVTLLDFYIDSMWSGLVALLLAILRAVLTKKTIIPPKFITRKIDDVALVPYVGPAFSYIFINDSVMNGSSVLDNLEGALATDTTRKGDQEWSTIMNILDRGVFFIIMFYVCIHYVL